ncbi:hypothetical protein [Ponticaulis sp.]|uniref:hypothetical protein n=1 Tax=Ponticaulis sp. TaxID=2020902 RepID=UPI000C67D950|nr:hypothetical protein [Ponticaulis sp.]MAJ08458.1 hypothetical protein [Ponticaulis sp.]HBH90238.1 hypothetical protein [Hyphomonadaceae bacterium]
MSELSALIDAAQDAYTQARHERGKIWGKSAPNSADTFAADLVYMIYDVESSCRAMKLRFDRGTELTAEFRKNYLSFFRYYEDNDFLAARSELQETWPGIYSYALAVQKLDLFLRDLLGE